MVNCPTAANQVCLFSRRRVLAVMIFKNSCLGNGAAGAIGLVTILSSLAGFTQAAEPAVTHGPILGRPTAHSMAVWARTSQPGAFRVRYGRSADALDAVTPSATTSLGHDNTGFTEISGLEAETTYHYEVFVPGGDAPSDVHRGLFHTLPDAEEYRNAEHNPRGLYNFRFEYACGNHQHGFVGGKAPLPTYATMLEQIAGKVDFSVLNGDWLYEDERDYTPDAWRAQVGIAEAEVPAVVKFAPHLVGVWENYKTYLRRGDELAAWHRQVPSFYTFDDHELLDDIHGAGSIGLHNRRAVFRDMGVAAWYDYLGWSNPTETSTPVQFGSAEFQAGSDVLTDAAASFRSVNFGELDNLHVHWGAENAWMKDKEIDDSAGGDPNSGVYEVVEVLDDHRLRIRPAAKADGTANYSVGRYSYGVRRMANCDIVFLDTRSHRQMPDPNHPEKPGLSLLGARQKAWLKQHLTESDADFFFLFSSVNFMIPHVLDVFEPSFANIDDSWTVFLEERNEMLDFFDALDKPVMLLTGDLHNSIVVQAADNVWEFASGPHNSGNARAGSEGNRMPNGPFDSRGRKCEIHWSSYRMNDGAAHRWPLYCVVRVNNVFNGPGADGETRWVAYPRPQVVFQYYKGLTGELDYAESILAAPRLP